MDVLMIGNFYTCREERHRPVRRMRDEASAAYGIAVAK
jgi:hypothetical protein